MKNTIKLLAIGFLATSLWSCGSNNAPTTAVAPSGEALLQNKSNRGKQKIDLGKLSQVARFSAADLKLDPATLETIRISGERQQQSEDAAQIISIFNNMQAAESQATALDLNFSMSDEPIGDGLFVFTINSEEKQKLMFEMYDEEGFELSANNALQLNQGVNYKAINVSGLNSGNYVFKLKNDEGEFARKVSIVQK